MFLKMMNIYLIIETDFVVILAYDILGKSRNEIW